jgi:ATP-dependent DNA helicase DinG
LSKIISEEQYEQRSSEEFVTRNKKGNPIEIDIDGFESFFRDILSKKKNSEFRQIQLDMSKMILKAIEEGSHCIIEAGTGSGKSFGYLIPAIFSGKTVVVSTGTIALQEQLIKEDLPFLKEFSGKDFKSSLMKGRSNYLCRIKHATVMYDLEKYAHREQKAAKKIHTELTRGWNGDKGTLFNYNIDREWSLFASTTEDCIKENCPYFSQHDSPYYTAKFNVQGSEIIVVNHSLYMMHLLTGGSIIPEHDFVIFDEAHHVAPTALNSLSSSVSHNELTKLVKKIESSYQDVPIAIQKKKEELESRLSLFARQSDQDVFTFSIDSEFSSIVNDISSFTVELSNWLFRSILSPNMFKNEELYTQAMDKKANLISYASRVSDKFIMLTKGQDSDESSFVRWIEKDLKDGSTFDFFIAPLNPTEYLQEYLWSECGSALLSATIADANGFNFIIKELGLSSLPIQTLQSASPFDYAQKSALFPVPDMPDVKHKTFTKISHEKIEQLISLTEGHALVLFTSNRAMNDAFNAISDRIPYPCKKQGDDTRMNLVDWKRTNQNSVLFATVSFWEGIDIPGQALQLVIMDKFPFMQSNHPVTEARAEQVKKNGGNPFFDMIIPETTIKLKQGFGRLLRTNSDFGIVAILDSRATSTQYGRKMLKSLPPAKIIKSWEELSSFYQHIKQENYK